MMGILILWGLAISAISVSTLGAAFSITGLAKLFSGATIAVCLMAGSLEFSKFVVAAFLHRSWHKMSILYRSYLLGSVIVLSMITSMGIFGFLSDAYQVAFVELTSQQIKIDSLKAQQSRNLDEIGRINRGVDLIPDNRVSKQIAAREKAEPLIRDLVAKNETLAEQIKTANLKTVEIKTKAGPLIYVAQAFHEEVDTIVKWLILVFVSVFDPLAICLVIATSEALEQKNKQNEATAPSAQIVPMRASFSDFIEKAPLSTQHEAAHANNIPESSAS